MPEFDSDNQTVLYRLLRTMDGNELYEVLRYFCISQNGCFRPLADGEVCHCENDE